MPVICAAGWSKSGGIFDQANAQKRIAELEARSAEADFWDDAPAAQAVLQETNGLRDRIAPFLEMEQRINDLETMCELLAEESEGDESAVAEQEADLRRLQRDI